MADKVIGFFE